MLSELYRYLKKTGRLSVDIRGAGKAQFLFAKTDRRAVEASTDEIGVWVEFWEDADEQNSKAPVRQESFSRLVDAQEAIVEWLR